MTLAAIDDEPYWRWLSFLRRQSGLTLWVEKDYIDRDSGGYIKNLF